MFSPFRTIDVIKHDIREQTKLIRLSSLQSVPFSIVENSSSDSAVSTNPVIVASLSKLASLFTESTANLNASISCDFVPGEKIPP